MSWKLILQPEARQDYARLDGSQRVYVRKAFDRLIRNPLPETEGGYGKWLGNQGGIDLSGCLKLKLHGAGLRIVYKLVRQDDQVQVIVIGVREDSQVYKTAVERLKKHQT